jgi:hypothetical protein
LLLLVAVNHIRPLAVAGVLATLPACVAPDSLRPGGGPVALQGQVFDDGAMAPGGHSVALSRVRIEVTDGPKAGAFVMSDNNGRFELPPLNEGPVTVRATKDGYDSKSEVFYPEYYAAPPLTLGQPPHMMWGEVRLVSSTMPAGPVEQVQVEILDGPNAGKVATSGTDGQYRFDDLIASPPFTIRVSKVGYTTRTYSKPELRHNRRDDLPVHPE